MALPLDQCLDDNTCTAGGDSNKKCVSGSCECATGYYSDNSGTCAKGENT